MKTDLKGIVSPLVVSLPDNDASDLERLEGLIKLAISSSNKFDGENNTIIRMKHTQ